MKKILCVLPLVLASAGCVQGGMGNPSTSTLVGGAAGAAIGSAVSGDDDRTTGAIIGGLTGAAAGSAIGRANQGGCVYQNAQGQRYVAPCP